MSPAAIMARNMARFPMLKAATLEPSLIFYQHEARLHRAAAEAARATPSPGLAAYHDRLAEAFAATARRLQWTPQALLEMSA